MTLDEMLDLIAGSNASDWTYITRPVFAQDLQQVSGGGNPTPTRWIEVQEHDQLLSYKPDLRISIATGLPHRDQFFEDWARDFPDKDASSTWVDFRFNGVPVLRELRVLVDGARAGLPCPRPGSMDIPERQYKIWHLIDQVIGSGRFDEYFNLSALKISRDRWPAVRLHSA
jgi:hypothetical protein